MAKFVPVISTFTKTEASTHDINQLIRFSAANFEVYMHLSRALRRGKDVCSNGPGHMTKMAAMPIYRKKLIFSTTKRPMTFKLCIQHWVLDYYQVNGFFRNYCSLMSKLVEAVN